MIGRSVSHYQLLEKLGAGGMGDVYRARDTRLTRTVAIKVLSSSHAANDESRQRFLREAQAASALNHPGIITIHDVVLEDETEFIVMEYVSGQTLADLIPADGLPAADVVNYSIQMADALSVAHAAGIVHRDLKPANVMVTQSGQVKILDFGLAKLSSRSVLDAGVGEETAIVVKAPLTVEGSILGTVAYMSPEQAQGRVVDARSDIFSFGVVVYEMVTGRRAFAGDNPLSTLSAILRDEVPPVSETHANVSPVLDQIVRKCLAKNPAARFQSMGEVRTALAALQHNSAAPTQIGPPVARRSLRTLLLAAAGVVLLAGGGWWAIARRHPALVVATPLPAPSAPTTPSVPAPALDSGVLTNDGVIAMVRAKVAPLVILQQIRFSPTRFDFSTSEIIRLTQSGVSPEMIETMRNPKRPPAAPSKSPSGAVATEKPVPPGPATGQPATHSIVVADGRPFAVRLAEDIPSDAEPGRPLRFTVVQDFRVGDSVVLSANAAVNGEVVDGARKKLIGGVKLTFRLKDVAAADGHKVSIRNTPTRRGAESKRAVESVSMARHSKEIAAPAGTEYFGYVDGEQTVTIPK
jgi:serine/threonine-protein kinase